MFARIARFEGLDPARAGQVAADVGRQLDGPPPEGLEGVRRVMILADRAAGRSMAVMLFDDEASRARADAALNAMAGHGGDRRRTAVEMYEVLLDRVPGGA